MEDLILFFKQLCPLSLEDEERMRLLWSKEVVLKRGEYLIEKGAIERSLFFVLEGTFRIYFPQDHDEISVGFGYKNTLLCSFPSFIRNRPSDYYIQALQKSKVLQISKTDFMELKANSPHIENAWQFALEEALLGKIDKETEMLAFAPQQRYERLLKRSPHIFQLIPKKYIASYLGMTPETLSRISPKH